MTAALAPWLIRHIRAALAKSQRRLFTQMSWGLLAVWVALIFSGLAMSAPALFWWVGRLWFPAGEISAALSLVHFWTAWIAVAGLILHLGIRHWKTDQK
ncbi:hypothetical protein [Devosia alba]|uniref:hypothetical protein n=1 Tax=Devosia alba TaxID=3152360 RepID=UPI00326300B9